jgi:hypothetical protein
MWYKKYLQKKDSSSLKFIISKVTAGLKPIVGNPGATIFHDVTYLQGEGQL